MTKNSLTANSRLLKWLDDVAPHDYDAALRYLSLFMKNGEPDSAVGLLRDAEIGYYRANDILRAVHRDPLPLDDPGVHRDLVKALKGERLSPVLLIAGCDIADGYHRVSLAYNVDPFEIVPARKI